MKPDFEKLFLWSDDSFETAHVHWFDLKKFYGHEIEIWINGRVPTQFVNSGFYFVLFGMSLLETFCFFDLRKSKRRIGINDGFDRSTMLFDIKINGVPLIIKEQLSISSHHDCLMLQDYLIERHPEFFGEENEQ